jgi:hypothetical protein
LEAGERVAGRPDYVVFHSLPSGEQEQMTRANEYQDRAFKAEARIKELEARDVIRESAWAEQIKRYQGELASARVHIRELEADLAHANSCAMKASDAALNRKLERDAIEAATIERCAEVAHKWDFCTGAAIAQAIRDLKPPKKE